MLRYLAVLAITFLLSHTALADTITGEANMVSCTDLSDAGKLGFRFFNPQVSVSGNNLLLSVDDAFYICEQQSDGNMAFMLTTQPETSALDVQYWTLFNIQSWDASFVGSRSYQTARIEIPMASFLSSDESAQLASGATVTKTFYLQLDSAQDDGFAPGIFDLVLNLQKNGATIQNIQLQ
jgi:hypothetical protein